MTDLISRQAALDALEWKWAGKAAIDAIKSLPSAQPEPPRFCAECPNFNKTIKITDPEQKQMQWVSLLEKEPDEEGEYLMSFDDGFIATTGYYDGDFELWADAGEPLAWMPLPAPYTEGEVES